MLNAVHDARETVLLEMYLVESGSIVERFIDALLGAANRGVRVYMLLDDFGAIGLKQHERKRLRHENIQLVYYNRLPSYSLLYNLYRVLLLHKEHSLYRNHRKLLLVDDDPLISDSLDFILSSEFDVSTVESRAEAVRVAKSAEWERLRQRLAKTVRPV